MDVSATKLKIIEWVLGLKDEDRITELKILSEETGDFWDKLPPSLKQDIKDSQQEYIDGKGITHEEVREKIKNEFGF